MNVTEAMLAMPKHSRALYAYYRLQPQGAVIMASTRALCEVLGVKDHRVVSGARRWLFEHGLIRLQVVKKSDRLGVVVTEQFILDGKTHPLEGVYRG